MNYEQAKQSLDATSLKSAQQAGFLYGSQEVDSWKDQHEGDFATAPAWSDFQYCGENPFDKNTQENEHDAFECVVDAVAKATWDLHQERADWQAVGDEALAEVLHSLDN